MCFSPQADLVGGVVVVAIGVDACRHLESRRSHLLLAGLPLLLGAHQAVEAIVWWGTDGEVSHEVARVALWIYLLVAFVVLPTFVPVAVRALEPTAERRSHITPFVGLGAVVSVVLLFAMLSGPIGVASHPYHLSYSLSITYSAPIITLYVVAVCGPLLFSGFRDVAIFGIANLAAVVVLAWLTAGGFASLWCAYAALAAAAIALHMRFGDREGRSAAVAGRYAADA
jgi:hypothetical protein